MKESKAISILKRYEKYRNKFVFWSGGKDSTVALHLAMRAWNDFRVVFIDTTITVPETLDYVRKQSKEWNLDLVILRPEHDFFYYARKWGFPAVPNYLWCRRVLKLEPIRRFYDKFYGMKIQVLGLRRSKSVARRKTKPILRKTHFRNTIGICPIYDWSKEDVFRYLRKYEIPINLAYRIYKRNSGCYFCPFIKNIRFYLRLKYEHPKLFLKLLNLEKEIRSVQSGKFKTLSKCNFSDIALQTHLPKTIKKVV
ncbi:MAG: phosphoadenosine phosphosulfate reductase family protein [Candidatus Njordarchaeum guaymaensis]